MILLSLSFKNLDLVSHPQCPREGQVPGLVSLENDFIAHICYSSNMHASERYCLAYR